MEENQQFFPPFLDQNLASSTIEGLHATVPKRWSPIYRPFPCEFGKDFWKALLNTVQCHLEQINKSLSQAQLNIEKRQLITNGFLLGSRMALQSDEEPGQKGMNTARTKPARIREQRRPRK